MVSLKQLVLTGAVCIVSVAPAFPAEGNGNARKFYPDDPILREPAPRPLRQVATRKVDDIYDFLENSYVTPGREGKAARSGERAARDVNTLGEVPDGDWYTNRHASRRMSIAELQRGPGNSTPPDPNRPWTVVGAKSDGVTPGFIIEDARKNRYLLKLDPVGYPELCSAADVIGSKFFYALGYFTPENYIVHFDVEKLAIPNGATWKDGNGRKHLLTKQAIEDMLRQQTKDRDGRYRALASRWLEGKVVGPFSYRGTRTDDPNDIVAHEDRRVLRGLKVFASWLNHHDTRSINSMDTLVEANGRQYLKHYLIDFGSTLGSAGYGPKHPWMGHEHLIARPEAAKQAVTLGLYVPRWMRSNYPKLTGVGLFDSWSFDPLTWKSNYPNPAFVLMDNDDAFWAAKQVAAFTDEEIQAVVQTGEWSDPRAAEWIARSLIERRDKIAAAWFARVLPLHNFRFSNGSLAFEDLGARAGIAREYEVRWAAYDNSRNATTPISATGARLPSVEGSPEFLAATVACRVPANKPAEGPCLQPVTVYLRRGAEGFGVVGIDR